MVGLPLTGRNGRPNREAEIEKTIEILAPLGSTTRKSMTLKK